MTNLADRIFYVRETVLGLRQEELAARLGVSRGAVCNWERGGGISPKNLKALASIARATLDWLMKGAGEAPAPRLNSEIYDVIALLAVHEAESRHLNLTEISAKFFGEAIVEAIATRRAEPLARLLPPSAAPIAPSKSKKPRPPKTS